MKKRPIVFAGMIGIAALLGWSARLDCLPVTPCKEVTTEPVKVLDNGADGGTEQGAGAVVTEQAEPGDAQPFSVAGRAGISGEGVDLSTYSISIRKEKEKTGFVISPSVTVKSGAVHIQLDQDDNKCIEIERNPPHSNAQVQIVMKKKF